MNAGLLAVVGKPVPGDQPEPFRRRYTLTERGRHAAEYGEYDLPIAAGTDKPVVVPAAELLETLAAGRTYLPPVDPARTPPRKR